MHGCVELHFHITIFTRVLYDDDTAAHQAQAHSLDKCLLIEKAFTDSSRTEDILFCLATVVPAIQKKEAKLPYNFSAPARQEFCSVLLTTSLLVNALGSSMLFFSRWHAESIFSLSSYLREKHSITHDIFKFSSQRFNIEVFTFLRITEECEFLGWLQGRSCSGSPPSRAGRCSTYQLARTMLRPMWLHRLPLLTQLHQAASLKRMGFSHTRGHLHHPSAPLCHHPFAGRTLPLPDLHLLSLAFQGRPVLRSPCSTCLWGTKHGVFPVRNMVMGVRMALTFFLWVRGGALLRAGVITGCSFIPGVGQNAGSAVFSNVWYPPVFSSENQRRLIPY